MPVLALDEKRRITLPREVVGDKRQKFAVVKTPDGILLKPLPLDPIKALQEEGKKLKVLSMQELKKAIEEEALNEVGGA